MNTKGAVLARFQGRFVPTLATVRRFATMPQSVVDEEFKALWAKNFPGFR